MLDRENRINVMFSLCGDVNKASSRVRGFWIAKGLEQCGVKCTLRWENSKWAYLKLGFEMPWYDVVIFQKTYSRYHRWLMELANWLGKYTYLDLDDSPSRTHSEKTLENIESMMHSANGVFAGSPALLNYASIHQAKTYLVPSGIDLEHYPVACAKSDSHKICLGWIGNGAHYARDLIDILTEPLKILAKRHTLKFKLVGACGVQELYDVFGAIESIEIDFVDQIEWSNPQVVSKAIKEFDIGLYPLLANDFNRYKCGFKALEYMASGIPVVSSPVAVNAEIVSHENDGLLADSRDEWINAIEQLIEDFNLRQDMGRAGRRKVEEFFDVAIISKQIKSILVSNLKASNLESKS